jgi:hypothetical protein
MKSPSKPAKTAVKLPKGSAVGVKLVKPTKPVGNAMKAMKAGKSGKGC